MKDNVKITIERAVNKAANAMRAVVKVFEEHGQAIPDEYVVKTFGHLRQTLNDTARRIDAARMVKMPAIGAFSLDAPMVEVERVSEIEKGAPIPIAYLSERPTEAAKPAAAAKPKWVKPLGRLVGTKETVYPQGEAENLPAEELSAIPDQTGFVKDAGFLDK